MDNLNWNTIKRALIFLIALILVAYIIVYIYDRVVFPCIISLIFVYLLSPVVNLLDSKLKISRTLSVLIVILSLLSIVIIVSIILYPIVVEQIRLIISLIPTVKTNIINYFLALVAWAEKKFLINISSFVNLEFFKSNVLSLVNHIPQIFFKVLSQTTNIVNFFIDIVLILIISFFILKHSLTFRYYIQSIIPPDLRAFFNTLWGKIDNALKAAIRGQITVAFIVGCLYMIGLAIVGLKAGVAIGFIMGVCRVVPYLELIVGIVLSAIVMIAYPSDLNWFVFLGTVMVITAVQWIDGLVIAPKILGSKIGLHPVIIIISLIAFAYKWGFWGVLITVPVLAVAKVIILMILEFYFSSSWFNKQKQ